MWIFVLIFTYLIAYIAEPLVALPLFLIVVISVSSFAGPKTGVISSVICGLLSDVLTGRPLGMTIMFFLAASFIIMLYKRKLKQESIIFMFTYTFIAVNIYLALFSKSGYFFPIQSLTGGIIVVALTYILYNIKSAR